MNASPSDKLKNYAKITAKCEIALETMTERFLFSSRALKQSATMERKSVVDRALRSAREGARAPCTQTSLF